MKKIKCLLMSFILLFIGVNDIDASASTTIRRGRNDSINTVKNDTINNASEKTETNDGITLLFSMTFIGICFFGMYFVNGNE